MDINKGLKICPLIAGVVLIKFDIEFNINA